MPHTTECLVPEDLLQHIVDFLEWESAHAGNENVKRFFDDVPGTIAELKRRLAD